jgi:hypothetical protein
MLGNSITTFATDNDIIVTNKETTEYTTVKYTKNANYSITIPKEIILNDNQSTSYEIKVSGNITSDMQINVEPVDAIEDEDGINFYMVETTSKKQVIATITQDSTSCLYNKVNDTNGATLSGNIGAISLGAGEWEGSLGFKICISTHEHDYNDEGICNDCGDVKVEKEIIANVTNGEATYDGKATNGNAKVDVTFPSNGYTITYGTTNETYDLDEIPTYTNPGTYEIYYKIEASNYTTKYGSFTITINERLNGYTWSEVQAICKEGNAKDYFKVGDETTISLGALPNANNATSAQIATIVIGDMTDTSLTLLVTSYSVEAATHVMNPETDDNEDGTNIGGWASTTMRTWLNDEYYNALSNDLQKVIATHHTSYSATYNATKVSYCDDKVWLLSSKEVFGGGTATSAGNATFQENLATFNSETQLAYFANGASRVRYNNKTAIWWWLRSSCCYNEHYFTNVDTSNSPGNDPDAAIVTNFVFPAFCIG